MTVRGVTLSLVLVVAVSCSDDEPVASPTTTAAPTSTSSPSTTAPERPASTTTTAFDPASVEGEVEAAYLRSWDVYADAVYHLELDEQALSEVYAGEGLSTLRDEIRRRIDEVSPALVWVDHNYEIVVDGPDSANVVDAIVNHQVLIDPSTKSPVEDDPNEAQLLNFRLERTDGAWRVSFIQRVNQ